MNAPFNPGDDAYVERFPTYGCNWCGAACPRCVSANALVARHTMTRRAVLDDRPAIRGRIDETLHYRLERRRPLTVEEARSQVAARPNRHDRRRTAAGDYCRCDGPECPSQLRGIAAPPMWPAPGDPTAARYFDGRRMQTMPHFYDSLSFPAGDTWDIRDPEDHRTDLEYGPYRGRRKRSPGEEWALMCRRVRGVVAGVHEWMRGDHGVVDAERRNARRGGRKTQLVRAIVAGGWRPAPDDPLGPEVAALTLRLQHWFKRRRRT